MSWEQFKAIVWLKGRLSWNQWRRSGGVFTLILMYMFLVSAISGSIGAFIGSLSLGILFLEKAEVWQVLLIWDGLVLGFLFYWTITVATEVQKSELIGLDKFLHLPTSLLNLFLINYMVTWVSLGLTLFASASLGFSLAMAYIYGIQAMLLIPLTLAFLFMVTSLSNQFRGWLAKLMTNPRRRRSLLFGMTFGIILICQLPNLFIQLSMRRSKQQQSQSQVEYQERRAQVARELEGNIEPAVLLTRLAEMDEEEATLERERRDAKTKEWNRYLDLAHQWLPPLWLPFSAKELTSGPARWSWLALFGMTSIGTISSLLSYRATIRNAVGTEMGKASSVGQGRGKDDSVAKARRKGWLEMQLPGLSEPLQAALLGNLIGLSRAPEAKMTLIMPIAFFGAGCMMWFNLPPNAVLHWVCPFLMLGVIAMVGLGAMMILANQFGMDRDGFRAYVLMPIERRDLLLAKNLSVLPYGIVIGAMGIGVLQWTYPSEILHWIGGMLQLAILLMMSCLIGNFFSMFFPMRLSPGVAKPEEIDMVTGLMQTLGMLSSILVLLPGVLSLALEFWIREKSGATILPIYIVVSIVEFALGIWIYSRVLHYQGRTLQKRETKLLQALTRPSE